MRYRFAAGIAITIAALVAMGQAAIQTFPPNTVWGRIGVGQFGPGGAIPLSTLAANLGFGTPAHSVPVGKGANVGGFNSATTGTSGAVLIDQGSGNDPAFVGISGSCSLAANGAMSCSGVGAGVTLINASITPGYTALTSDCLKTIAVSGGTQATIAFNSAATYGACTIDVINNNSWTSPAGVLLTVTGMSPNPGVLYPGMTMTLININGVWAQKPGVVTSQAPLGTKLYVDGVNGSNGNDCLSTSTACQDLNYVTMHLIWGSLLASAGSGTGSNAGFDIRLIADPGCVPTTGANCIHGLHFSGYPKQIEGHNSILIECDSGSATNCTIADNSGNQAIGCFVPLNLELRNVTLAGGSTGNNAIQAERCMVRLEGGVVIAMSGGVAQISAINGGIIVNEGGGTLMQVSGTAAAFAQTAAGGQIILDQSTVQWIGNSTYTGGTLNANTWSLISASGTTWQPNGFTITAGNNIVCGPGGVVSTGGSIASVPGTNSQSGCVASGNGQVN